LKVLITGASRGIGREIVKRYISKANKIYAIASSDKIYELSSDKIKPYKIDLSNFEEIKKYKNEFIDVDIAIFNAAISLPHSDDFPSFEDFKKTFDINLLSIHLMLEGILPYMRKKNNAKIVFISSLASLVGAPTSIAYSSSKRALNSYAQSLRNLTPNINVINIMPGFIKTDMTAKNNFYMPFLMELEEGVDKIMYAIENNKKEYAFPKRFYYIIKLFNTLPINLQDKLLQKITK